MPGQADLSNLFRHVTADKVVFYRCIMDVFAAAKRQYRLQLRADEVLSEGHWASEPPTPEQLGDGLRQLTLWGNLEAQPDTARVSTLADFYRARFLYRLSQGGEAVETALSEFEKSMQRRAELQTVALEDISSRLQSLKVLTDEHELDPAKLHEALRDLVRVFEGLAENAQSFMAGVARSLELQRADPATVINYKTRLIDYLDRFIGDLVRRSDPIAQLLQTLSHRIDPVLWLVAEREARDAAPADTGEFSDAKSRLYRSWRERWHGLRGWFLNTGHEPPQAGLLRARAIAAIPQLLNAIAMLNERRSGRSDRSADFRVLAGWFASCEDDIDAHRLARAAFALNPARHFSLNVNAEFDLPPTTPWADAPPLKIHPRLREYGEATPRGPLARVRDRSDARRLLGEQMKEEARAAEAAKAMFATGRPTAFSELPELDKEGFELFLSLLGESLAEKKSPDDSVDRLSADGLLHIRLEPIPGQPNASIACADGTFSGPDHRLTVSIAASEP